jgi:hypothetical protein
VRLRARELASTLLILFAICSDIGAEPPVDGSLPWFSPSPSGSFESTNSLRYKNRPLYGPHNGALILTGDRPITHLADDTVLYGGFLFGVVRAGAGVWAHNADTVNSAFHQGSMRWSLRDSHLPGVDVSARVLSGNTGTSMVIDINVTVSDAAELVWAFGCGTTPQVSGNRLGWAYDPLINPKTLNWTFSPEDCVGNNVNVAAIDNTVSLQFGPSYRVVASLETAEKLGSVYVKDAMQWQNITYLAQSAGGLANDAPLGVGRSPLPAMQTTRFTWSVVANPSETAAEPLAQLAAGESRLARLTRTRVTTPDLLVNAAVQALGLAVDGLFRDVPGAFVHGAMAWDSLYLGWRSQYGATVLGQPELVAKQGNYFFAKQVVTSSNRVCNSSAALLMTQEDQSTSRWYFGCAASLSADIRADERRALRRMGLC